MRRLPLGVANPAVRCPNCDLPMILKGSRFGPFYSCPNWPACTEKHGAHRNGRPLGIPGDKATRMARKAAHDAFDVLWRDGWHSERGEAYGWLAGELGMTLAECHIGRFDKPTCGKVIAICQAQAKKYDSVCKHLLTGDEDRVCMHCGTYTGPRVDDAR